VSLAALGLLMELNKLNLDVTVALMIQ